MFSKNIPILKSEDFFLGGAGTDLDISSQLVQQLRDDTNDYSGLKWVVFQPQIESLFVFLGLMNHEVLRSESRMCLPGASLDYVTDVTIYSNEGQISREFQKLTS